MTWSRRHLVPLALGALGWLWTAVAVVPWILAAPRLPDPVATHWDLGGTPDGSLPLLAAFALVCLLSGFPAVIASAVLLGRGRRGSDPAIPLAVLGALGAFAAGVSVVVVRANLDAARWQEAAPVGAATMLGVVAAAAVVGAVLWKLIGSLPAEVWLAPGDVPPPGAGLDAGDGPDHRDDRWWWAFLVVAVLVGWTVTTLGGMAAVVAVPVTVGTVLAVLARTAVWGVTPADRPGMLGGAGPSNA